MPSNRTIIHEYGIATSQSALIMLALSTSTYIDIVLTSAKLCILSYAMPKLCVVIMWFSNSFTAFQWHSFGLEQNDTSVLIGYAILILSLDGEAELTETSILDTLKKIGSISFWNAVDILELNVTSERKFRTLSEQCLSMLLQSCLSVYFWWECYEASNFITNRLSTKTARGYTTPFKRV